MAYALSSYYVLDKITATQTFLLTIKAFSDPDELQQFSYSREFKEFYTDDKMQYLAKDEELQDAIRTKNFLQIIGNSSLRDVFLDDKLMKKLSVLYKKVYASRATEPKKSPSK